MIPYQKHLVREDFTVKDVLKVLDELAADAIVFLVDEDDRLIGSITDGDFRRGFIRGLGFENPLSDFIQPDPKFIQKANFELSEIIAFREKNFKILPIVDKDHRIVNVVNFRSQKSYLPVDALIMAGGRGARLKPLTDHTPKPMLKVGDKPILERNIDRLKNYGIDDIWISVRYLGDQIKSYFGDGSERSLSIQYAEETEALGTAGALALMDNVEHDTVLLMNSDLLTNIDFEAFYLFYRETKADLAVACIPYHVNVPYAVMETDGNKVTGFKEKPTYTHFSNAGIYLLNKEVVEGIPRNKALNATDLMEELIREGKSVVSYPHAGYWLDIGKHEDYLKASEDIKRLKL
ncbi:nucleotidyltransferase family protein [Cryomorphaceae bacterium 1068]|nr:nucleotidyltransferase family protein [Cryomorphaceae bacterium 1068]